MKIEEIYRRYGQSHTGFNVDTGAHNTGGDMEVHGYSSFYEDYFSVLRSRGKINLLEIGIFRGGGLVVWSDYFSDGYIYGVDIGVTDYFSNIEVYKAKGGYSNNNVTVNKGDSTDKLTWDKEIETYPLMDIIIDDGAHNPTANQSTLVNFWDKLKDGGLYVIEDIRPIHLDLVQGFLSSRNFKYKLHKGNKGEYIAFIIK